MMLNAGGIAGLSLFAAGALVVYLMYPAFKTPAPPDFPVPDTPAEAARQDITYLKYALRELDRSFSPESWAALERAMEDLSVRAESLDAAALEMGLAKAVATANNGHTNVMGVGWGLTLNSIPLKFYWFSDGLYAVQSDASNADLLGARVLTIGGRSPGELSHLFRPYVGGANGLARELSVRFMRSPEAMRAVGLQESPSAVYLRLETRDGKLMERSVAATAIPSSGPLPEAAEELPAFDPRELYWSRRDLSPIRLPEAAPHPRPTADGRQWTHILDGTILPLSLRDPNRFYWADELPEWSALFVQINTTLDEPGRQPLQAFLRGVLDSAAESRPRFAILDLRSNPGGSYLLTAAFTRKLPSLIPEDGRIFILTSGNTYSAGVIAAARLKYFSGARGEIVGEPMGDHARFWAEAATRIVLPNSGLRVGYATGYHDWENSCSLRQIRTCYLPNYFLGVAAGSLDPTIPVSWSFTDYVAGKDTVLEEVLQIIAATEGPGRS
jgi:hypothetical protein